MLVVSALKKYGTGITAAQLRAYLASLRGFPGVMGRYDFTAVPQRGLTEQSVFIMVLGCPTRLVAGSKRRRR